jgi:uncharacterized protein (TIGR03435 family)
MQTVLRGGRYELLNATMVDLIRTAYGVPAEKVVGGPNWLEYDRFDVIAKAASNTPQETLRLMLQTLLADRFKLAVKNETVPIPGFVLTLGNDKPKLKAAEPSGEAGCRTQPATRSAAPVAGQIVLPTTNISCRSVTMETFASSLAGFAVGYFTGAVVDRTGLKGAYDFDVKWTVGLLISLAGAERTTVFEAIDKQLGLKLEEQKIPQPVIMVDMVNKTPTPNPPDVAAKLPVLPPAEFEVATIRPSAPITAGALPIAGGVGMLPGGRVNLPRFPMRLAISLAWNLNPNSEIPGAPKWIDSAIFDIVAKVPEEMAPAQATASSLNDLGPMLQNLLKDRFGMKVRFEDRMVTAYTLVGGKHKLKKADPSARTGCKTGNSPVVVNAGPLSLPARQITCQNMTMAQFADHLQILAGPYLQYPVLNATEIEGAWDFTFSFSPIPPSQLAGMRTNPFAGAQPAGAEFGASDPIGGTSIFDAVEKDLGLKLEQQKRSYPVFIIDHIEEKPIEN